MPGGMFATEPRPVRTGGVVGRTLRGAGQRVTLPPTPGGSLGTVRRSDGATSTALEARRGSGAISDSLSEGAESLPRLPHSRPRRHGDIGESRDGRSAAWPAIPECRSPARHRTRYPEQRVANPKLPRRLDNAFPAPLPGKFRRMHADDDKSRRLVPLVPGPQLRDHVLAADSAVGPESKQHDPSAEPIEREGAAMESGLFLSAL